MRYGDRAPAMTYRRKRKITVHAVERARERGASDIKAMTFDLLANALDSAVEEAIAAGHFEQVKDHGCPAKIVDLSHTLDLNVVAVVKKDKSSDGSDEEAVITVLTPEMAAVARARGDWKRDDKPMGFATLGDKLRSIVLPPAAVAKVETVLEKMQAIAPAQPANSATTEPAISRLVRWWKGGSYSYQEASKDAVPAIIERLMADGVELNDIDMFKWVPIRSRVVVEVGE